MNIQKSSLGVLLIAGVNVSVINSVLAEPAITDYQEATSSYEDAYITGNFNLNSGNQDQASYDLDLTIDYEKVFSSPSRNIKLDFLGIGSRSRGPQKNDPTQSDYQASGSVTMDSYFQPNSKGTFWYGKAEAGVKKGQKDPFSKLTGGMGFGHVVNVTPMARSIRLIQGLRKRGSLTRDPLNITYQNIATIIDKEGEYVSKYGSNDYEEYWIEAIEKELKKSGFVKGKGDLGARAILKSYTILVKERISTRKKGWLARAGIGVVLSNYDGGDSKPVLEIGAEYHHPINNVAQFSNEAVYSATFDDNNNGFNFNNTMSLTYELSDRVDWENQWKLDHSKSDISNNITSNTVSSSFRYYLNNQLNFDVTAKLHDTEDNIRNNNNDELDKSLTMGITYRLK